MTIVSHDIAHPRAHTPRDLAHSSGAQSPSGHVSSVRQTLARSTSCPRSGNLGRVLSPRSGALARTTPGHVLLGGARRTGRRTVPLRPYLLHQARSPSGPVRAHSPSGPFSSGERGERARAQCTLRPYLLRQRTRVHSHSDPFSSGGRGERARAQCPSDPIFSVRRTAPQALSPRARTQSAIPLRPALLRCALMRSHRARALPLGLVLLGVASGPLSSGASASEKQNLGRGSPLPQKDCGFPRPLKTPNFQSYPLSSANA